ncbi:MAG: hypothetical protein K2Z81_26485 [Cyanobacteria bacterium]|nr:hypothetical protein [Cyanobacteriota bacterium]
MEYRELVVSKVEEAKCLLQEKNVFGAELLLNEALSCAQKFAGSRSSLAGVIYLELYDLYETQGRKEEANKVWMIIREILRTHRYLLTDGAHE